ncbi:MAG: hypothetical protein JOZ58_25930 [Acetobacteraceae bacterium]|jgi:ElaB/YqjD/DUF883 family membrane-anchored ribosome-binding protein|nr:hypothetical protein [Acetobacteraceae bacterium]MBV8578460.1 hypothetical protein [Acetobacteraceae bacterium]
MSDKMNDAKEQIAKLREQVEMLMRDRVTPVLSDAAGRAETAYRQAGDVAREQAEALTGRVREQPIIALLVAAAAGYLIGRMSR